MTIIPISEINVEDFPDLREALENLAGKTDHFIVLPEGGKGFISNRREIRKWFPQAFPLAFHQALGLISKNPKLCMRRGDFEVHVEHHHLYMKENLWNPPVEILLSPDLVWYLGTRNEN